MDLVNESEGDSSLHSPFAFEVYLRNFIALDIVTTNTHVKKFSTKSSPCQAARVLCGGGAGGEDG